MVRDLGAIEMTEIKEVFRRINSTRYSLNAMETHNARYDGEFKLFGDFLAQDEFFERHRVFSANDFKRMQDTRYTLTLVATVMGGYFNRDDDLDEYLARYNDEFAERPKLEDGFQEVLKFIEQCGLAEDSRAWKKSDLFTLIVECYWALFRHRFHLQPDKTHDALEAFYKRVDNKIREGASDLVAEEYHLASVQASNDRVSRAARGKIIGDVLKGVSKGASLF